MGNKGTKEQRDVQKGFREGIKSLLTQREVATFNKDSVTDGFHVDKSRLEQICDALEQDDGLKELHISKNKLDYKALRQLAKSLPFSKNLTTLDLSENQIDDEGALYLAKVLPLCKNLASLDLSNNIIGDMGVRALENAKSPTLHINFVGNLARGSRE